MTFTPMFEKITDHAEVAKMRLNQQFLKPVDDNENASDYFQSMVKAHADQIQEIEDCLFEMQEKMSLGFSTEVTLTQIGTLEGESRYPIDSNPVNDDDYRDNIRIRQQINASCGTVNDIIRVLKYLGFTGKYILNEGDATVFIYIQDDVSSIPLITEQLINSKSAGITMVVQFSSTIPFSWYEDTDVNGKGFADYDDTDPENPILLNPLGAGEFVSEL
jgi:hypothetical protein